MRPGRRVARPSTARNAGASVGRKGGFGPRLPGRRGPRGGTFHVAFAGRTGGREDFVLVAGSWFGVVEAVAVAVVVEIGTGFAGGGGYSLLVLGAPFFFLACSSRSPR